MNTFKQDNYDSLSLPKSENDPHWQLMEDEDDDDIEELEMVQGESWELVTENRRPNEIWQNESNNRPCKFNKKWEMRFPWLGYDPLSDTMHCQYCRTFPHFSKKISGFIKGTPVFYLKSIRIHETSQSHAAACKAMQSRGKEQGLKAFTTNGPVSKTTQACGKGQLTKNMMVSKTIQTMKNNQPAKGQTETKCRPLNKIDSYMKKSFPPVKNLPLKKEASIEFSKPLNIEWKTELRPSVIPKRSSACNLKDLTDSESPSQYQKYWEKEFPWLQYDSVKKLMYCSSCRQYSTAKSSFVTGTSVFHLNTVRCHAKSHSHHEAFEIASLQEQYETETKLETNQGNLFGSGGGDDGEDDDDVLVCESNVITSDNWPRAHFQKNWQIKFPWLLYDESKNCMYCTTCMKYPNFSGKRSTFIKGSSVFNVNSITAHEVSQSHILSTISSAESNGTNHVFQTLDPIAASSSGSNLVRKPCSETKTLPSVEDRRNLSSKFEDTSKYQHQWEVEYPWLKYDDKENHMFCEYCREFPQFSDKRTGFIKGTNLFQLNSIRVHNMSHGHLEASDAIDNLLESLQKKHCKFQPEKESAFPAVIEDDDGEWELCEEVDSYRPRGGEKGPRYKKSWEEQFPWLSYNPDVNLMYCTYCCNYPEFGDRRSSFIRGSAQFLKINVRQHNDSKSHTRCYHELLQRNKLNIQGNLI